MKEELKVLIDRPIIQVVLTRDSVCMADDVDAPHEKIVEVPSFTEPKTFAKQIASSGYLPSIAGSGHTWVCELNGLKIARFGLLGVKALVPEIAFLIENRAHFIYHSARN
jgi:hypothetical protein